MMDYLPRFSAFVAGGLAHLALMHIIHRHSFREQAWTWFWLAFNAWFAVFA